MGGGVRWRSEAVQGWKHNGILREMPLCAGDHMINETMAGVECTRVHRKKVRLLK